MKKSKIILFVSSIFACLIIWQACQKDEEPATLYQDVETMQLKSADVFDCSIVCIDPDDPEYFVVYQELVVGWAGTDNNKFNKTVEVRYYNTLTHFVLQVMSSNGIADVLMDDVSVKNFDGTIPPNEWQEFSFELEADWEACDTWGFGLVIAGFGPPASFEVEYPLIGECIYYTLTLAVNLEDAGTVTGEGEYMEGEEVALTAIANEGYVFVNWTDEDGNEISPIADFMYSMPAEDHTLTVKFEEESRIEEMVHINEFWIDRFEASLKQISTPQGTILAAASLEGAIPVVGINQLEAAELCAYAGKRLCTDNEWLRACRGPDGYTYPYGNIEVLDACNGGAPNESAILLPTGNCNSCASFEGIMDMVGNVGEWTTDPSGTYRGGNFFEAVINGPGCLYRTTAHSVYHSDQKTGFRCCADQLPIGIIEYITPEN